MSERKQALHDRVENDFTYHPPTDQSRPKFERITAETKKLAHLLVDLCPEGRDLSLALTDLENIRMRANAAVAKGGS